MVKNPPASAGDMSSIPGPRRLPAVGQLSPSAPLTTKAVFQPHVPQLLKSKPLESLLHNKKSYSNEKPAHHN